MLPTIDRYLLKEVVLTFFATVLVLLAMVLSNRLAGYLNQVANGLLSKNAVFLLLGLQAINLLVILTPLSLLLSIMLALGRLYRDSEMIALTACGIGPAAVYRPLFLFAVPLAMVIAGFSLYVLPLCIDLQFDLEAKARQEAEVSMFTPGTFRELADGQHVIYVGALMEGGKELRKIFIQSRTLEGIAITTGERGYQKIDSKSGARYVVLSDGYRYEGNPGQGDYRNLHFQQLSVRLESVPPSKPGGIRKPFPPWNYWTPQRLRIKLNCITVSVAQRPCWWLPYWPPCWPARNPARDALGGWWRQCLSMPSISTCWRLASPG